MTPSEIAARNKTHYLQAKQAFNEGNLEACLSFYSRVHQLRSRPSPAGRAGIQAFFEQSRRDWPGLRLDVEHALAEGDLVMGMCNVSAIHEAPFMGVPSTGKAVHTTFWDLHRFDNDGLIVESWNLLDGVSIMAALGLLPASR